VITIPRSVRIFIGSTPIDMRKSIDGLMAIVQEECVFRPIVNARIGAS